MISWKRYAAALILNAALVLGVLFLKGFDLNIYYVDAFSVAGSVSILLGLLVWITEAGAFDTIGYGFSILFGNRRDKSLYEYTLRHNEKRGRHKKSVFPYIVTGIVFVAISFLIPLE